MSQENVVRYWHAAELLQPQSAPKPKKRDTLYASFFHDTTVRQLVPAWSPDSLVAKQLLPKKRTWSHTLYAHLYDSRVVAVKRNLKLIQLRTQTQFEFDTPAHTVIS